MVKVQDELKEILGNLSKSDRRKQDLDDCIDKLTEFENALTAFRVELSSLDNEDKKVYKKKCQEYERSYDKLSNELEWQKSYNVRDELIGEAAGAINSLNTDDGLIEEGKKTLAESKMALERMQGTISDTQAVAIATAAEMNKQQNQLTEIHDNIGKMDTTLSRANKYVRRVGRKMISDKLLWVMLFLVFVCILVIIIYKYTHNSDTSIYTPNIPNN